MEVILVCTIQQIEGTPASYPAAPSGLSDAAAALGPAFVWARIEHYIAHRFSERSIVWIVEGAGYWLPPLSPATITTFELWNNDSWEVIAALPGSPLGGYTLRGCGPYRFTGTVGAGPVPEIVDEAYRRLAEYFAGVSTPPGVRQEAVEGIATTTYDIAGVASGMQRSGAADLLRSYRRAV